MFKMLAIVLMVPASAAASGLPDLNGLRGIDVPGMVQVDEPIAPSVLTGGKIVGGVEAQKGEFPFMVSLRSSWGSHFCGGSLIRKNWVLTAAHCVDGGYLKGINVGLHNQSDTAGVEKFTPAQIVVHPGWNTGTMANDFALVKLSGDSRFEPVKLNTREIGGSAEFVTAGWGATSEGGGAARNLMKVAVPFVDQASCEASYPGSIDATMICAGYKEGGKDSCQGDSGGPLVMGSGSNRSLVGVVSWGEGCARPNKYGVYAKVSHVIGWIEENTK